MIKILKYTKSIQENKLKLLPKEEVELFYKHTLQHINISFYLKY